MRFGDRSFTPRAVSLWGAVFAAIVTLPGLGIGTLWDNSETAYGEVAREILITGDPVVMHLNGLPWFVQPPLYFWLAALAVKAFGLSSFALRLPSALATVAIGAVTGGSIARASSPRAALVATLVLATSLMQAIIGRLAIMDALLDLAIVAGIFFWFEAASGAMRFGWLFGAIAVALGTLAKGPVAPVATVLVVVPWWLWERRLGTSPRLPSLKEAAVATAVALAIVVPWVVALVARVGPSGVSVLVGHYTVGRYLGTIENQSGPIWYYLPVIVLGFFPWTAFLLPSIAAAVGRVRDPAARVERLSLVWTALPIAFFSFAQTKLPNYIAFVLPGCAALVGIWFDRVAGAARRRAAVVWAAGLPIAIGAMAYAASVFAQTMQLRAELPVVRADLFWLGAIVMGGSLACFAALLWRRTAALAPFALGAACAVAMLAIAIAFEPGVERFKPIPPLAKIIDEQRRPDDVVAIAGVSGGNALVFYTLPGVATFASGSDVVPNSENDARHVICTSSRVFVVARSDGRDALAGYGRERHALATADGATLFLFDGPPCT